MKIAITGINGFIGKNLVEFYKYKHELRLIERQDNFDIFLKLTYFKPDIIINCAAEIYDENKMWSSNVDFLINILSYCKIHKCKLIQFGSSSEYGRKNHPIIETDFLNPTTIYENTKAIGTLLCNMYSKNYEFKCTVIRPLTIVGRYEKPHKFFSTLYKTWKNNSILHLSEAVHDFVFIDDFIKAVDIIIFYKEDEYFNIINVGSGIQTSNQEIVETFEKILNYKYQINKVEKLREYDSMSWVCNPSLLLNKYKIEVLTSYKDYIYHGIKKFIDDCQRLKLYES